LAGPTKLVLLPGMRFNAAVGRTRTRRGETGEEGEQQEEWGVSSMHRPHRGGSVRERATDVVRGREESGSWRQRKVVLRSLGCDLRDPNSPDLVLFFKRKRRQEPSTKQAATGIANRRDAGRHHRLPVVPPPPTRLPHHPSGRSPCLLRLRTLGHKPSK
jgi:hypothetical protein